MATRTAAEILKWDGALGSLEADKRPDLLVIDGDSGDPYQQLLQATEREVKLVFIAGVARYGEQTLVTALGAQGLEPIQIAGQARVLNLRQQTADPVVGQITLAEAKDRLEQALANLKQLAEQAEQQGSPLQRMLAAPEGEVQWGLALDELEPTGVELRPRVPLPGTNTPTGPSLLTAAPAKPLSQVLGPLTLDSLTVPDDPHWLDTISIEQNLPAWLAPGLRQLY